ncbi:hypothetical protein SLEP1_g32050 [Rubroshorea leprosula]|uniref:Pectinesterase inhibitor domain-containing protein n=1 Tax=Rubroshorea leprosula TaxID=152421 RepID=A0AAV5KC64_9ROSI|nr:hypothetical protein SLEP1_g32050 [Rubroshorea leprosula]
MERTEIFLSFSLLVCILNLGGSAFGKANDYVRDACSVTRYQDLCIHSLAPFSHIAKRSPSKWARAGVSVTLAEVKEVAQYLTKLKKSKHVIGRKGVALSDCVEVFGNAVDELHKSLAVLRKLNARNFEEQIEDLTTWLSAVLTDEDTCLEGLKGTDCLSRKELRMLQNRVLNTTYFTSNALALVNKLATTGLGSFDGP